VTELHAGVRTADLPTDGVPILAAATVLIVDDRPDLKVLTMRRSAASSFVAGHTVFPGGRLDDVDRDPAWTSLVTGLDPDDADRALSVADGGLAHWIAAVRETLEEVGLMIGFDDPTLVAQRRSIEGGDLRFRDALAAAGCRLDLSGMHPVGRWVTPPPSEKRYDTYFFVARAAPGAEPVADGREAVEVGWIRPVEALELWQAGEMTLISPTISMFQRLAGFGSADEVLAAAAYRAPAVQARVLVDPVHGEGSSLVWWPGDAGYTAPGTRPTMGWMWLPGPTPPGGPLPAAMMG
jgi:8-oxo-dGTP pyrophosphatase MutT (NUDIX family)